MRDILPVVVDGLWRQGAKNLAVRLVSAEGQPLPAWTPGAMLRYDLKEGFPAITTRRMAFKSAIVRDKGFS